MTLLWIGTGLVQLAQDWSNETPLANWESIGTIVYLRKSPQSMILNWSNDTPLANWESIGMIRFLEEFISRSAPWSFPFIKGNDRGAVIEMNPVL